LLFPRVVEKHFFIASVNADGRQGVQISVERRGWRIPRINCPQISADELGRPGLREEQFLALYGEGRQSPDFWLRFRKPPLSIKRLMAMVSATDLQVLAANVAANTFGIDLQ
jgi:hypothetical protein